MNNLFNLIVAETARMAGVLESSIPLSRGYKKCWTMLATYWEEHPDLFPDVFYKALIHIATCKYPRNSSKMEPLLILIEKAILSDDVALRCWGEHISFSGAFNCARKWIGRSSKWKSRSAYLFVARRLYYLTFCRETFTSTVNIATATAKQLKRLHTAKVVEYKVNCFKDVIATLIPDASSWSDKQWVDEKYIFARIKSTHGIDYQVDPKAFDLLFNMLKKKYAGIPYTRELFLIKHIPNSMAQVIWPQNMEKELCKQFLTICKVKPRVWNECPFSQEMQLLRQMWSAVGYLLSSTTGARTETFRYPTQSEAIC